MPNALITGINGMDGSHLADLLLSKGYTVFGLERRKAIQNRTNVKHIEDKITFIAGDLSDQQSLTRALEQSAPTEVYNLAAQSFVGESWNTPEYTADITGLGVLRMLEAIKTYNRTIRFYQASSSEMFGTNGGNLANEKTPFHPRSPYGVAKAFGHNITVNYRESFNMFACNGILFNHESERRGLEFVTRKITNGVARISLGKQSILELGNLDAQRDWGYAPDYVYGMWQILQQPDPDDFVIARGIAYSVRTFLDYAFAAVGILNWEPYVITNPKFIRPAEIDVLKGDYQKAINAFDFKHSILFQEMVYRMVQNDIELEKGRKVKW